MVDDKSFKQPWGYKVMSHVQFLRQQLATLEQAFFDSWPGSTLRESLSSDIVRLRRELSTAESA
jgi:hypothetical protein